MNQEMNPYIFFQFYQINSLIQYSDLNNLKINTYPSIQN